MGARTLMKKAKRKINDRASRWLLNRMNPKLWHRMTDFVQRCEKKRVFNYVRDTDFTKLDVRDYKRVYILSGRWRFLLFNMHCCTNMLSLTAYCLSRRELPYIAINKYWGEGAVDNLWNQFLEQPFQAAQGDAKDATGATCELNDFPLFNRFPTQEDINVLSKLYHPPLFVLNEQTRTYVEDEYREIFLKRGSPRVCGVLCRGTDYLVVKNHPIQPKIEDVIAFTRRKMEELNCEYIYLATDEYRTQRMFDEAFPGKVLINKRQYYDEFWELKEQVGDDARIGSIHKRRENDDYLRCLEYLSSLVLLSRCQALIAGICNGSRTALYMNGGKYEYWHLFDLGINREAGQNGR